MSLYFLALARPASDRTKDCLEKDPGACKVEGPEDPRSAALSWQLATGASLPVIGKTLNHKSVSATAIYARLNIDPVRAAVERATAAMLSAAGQKKKAEIFNFTQVKRGAKSR